MKYFTKQSYENNQKDIPSTPEMRELENQIIQLFSNNFDENNPWSEEILREHKKSQNAYDDILCNEDEDIAKSRKATKDYWEHYRQIESHLPKSVRSLHESFGINHMHDCLVTGNGLVDKDFCMDIKSTDFCVFGPNGEDDLATIEKLTFINAEILEKDNNLDLQNAYWVTDEVYLHQDRKDRYEMHILFYVQDKDNALSNDLAEMIIIFDDIIIDGNWVVED